MDERKYYHAVLTFANASEHLRQQMTALKETLAERGYHAESANVFAESVVALPTSNQILGLFATAEHIYLLDTSVEDAASNE